MSGAWGFCSEKVQDCGRVTSYELNDMRNGSRTVVARLASLPVPRSWEKTISHGPFLFNLQALEWARALLETAINAGADTFFIDELGKLELNGSGLHDTIRRALDSGMDIYISIRDTNVDDAVKAFNIGEYKIIKARE